MNSRTRTTLCSIAITLTALVVSFAVIQAQAPPAGGGRAGGARGGAPGNARPPTTPVTGNAASGKTLYFNYSCYGCHGFNGDTGRAFVGNWTFNLANEKSFVAFLRFRANMAPAGPSTAMPNYPESSLSDKQAKDIYAYIRTFKSQAPELKDIPALTQIVNAASKQYKP